MAPWAFKTQKNQNGYHLKIRKLRMGFIVGSKVGSIHLKIIEKSKEKKGNKKNIKRLTNYLIYSNIR